MKEYKIGDIAALTGLNPQTIRRYSSAGLLKDIRSEESGFRSYTSMELVFLMRARLYRSYGFSLDETNELINGTIGQNRDLFLKRRVALERDRLLLDCKLECISEQLKALEMAAIRSDTFEISTRPAMLGLPYRSRDELEEDKVVRERIAQWVSYMPMVRPWVLMQKDFFDSENGVTDGEYKIGLCIHQKFADLLGFSADERCYIIPEVKAVHMIYHAMDENVPSSSFIQAKQYLRDNNLTVNGLPMQNAFFCTREEDGAHHLSHMWIPVK